MTRPRLTLLLALGSILAILAGGFWALSYFKTELVLFRYSLGSLDSDIGFLSDLLVVSEKSQDFLTIALSVFIESLPFLILGTLISVLIQRYVSVDVFRRLLPKSWFFRRLMMSFLGVLLPVCECGNVPLARSLMNRGASVGDALTFLLAAPILNPLVLLTTWQAFQFEETIVIGRFVAGFLIANLVAIGVTTIMKNRQIITEEFEKTCLPSHNHGDEPGVVPRNFATELWPMLKMLALGSAIAGGVQLLVPREVLTSIGNDPVMGIIVMIALGFVISICSNVDAFFALSFARAFSPGALTAFMVSGPMIDIKMIALLKTTFTTRAIMLIAALVFGLSFISGIIINTIAL